MDDEHVHLAAFRAVLAPLGIEISDRDYFERYIGFDDVGAFRAMLEDHGRAPTDDDVTRWVEEKRPVYMHHAREGLVVFPGAAELVRRQSARGPVAVVSGALRDEITFGLGVLGVADEVSFVISAEDTSRSKPDPEGYRLAMKELGVERGLVIEDSPAGVSAAKAAGLTCLAVAHSAPENDLVGAGADRVVARIAEVDQGVIEELERRADA